VRRRQIIQLTLLSLVVAGATFPLAYLVDWLPEDGSIQGKRIDDVILTTVWMSVAIFALVAAVLVYAIVKFRAKPGDMEDGKPVHGHTGLELAWTAIPTVIVVAIAVFSSVVVVKNDELPSDHRVVLVEARQFAWGFEYPELGGLRTGQLVLPIDQPVELQMYSPDVIHAFWVPEWRQKQDVVPGITTVYRITPTKLGKFPIVCTELCGLGHSVMRNQVVVLSQEEFDLWAEKQRADVDAGGDQLGENVFANQGCAGCHVLNAAGATGAVGPDLDIVVPGQDIEQIIESIVNPDAAITEGFSSGIMPRSYAGLPDDQLQAVADYLRTQAGPAE